MFLLDANILLYAYNAKSPAHERSRRWLEAAMSEEPAVGIPWTSIQAFLRVATNPRAQTPPLSISRAIHTVQTWLERPNVQVVAPGPRQWQFFSALLAAPGITARHVTDAHLAALALENGATMVSTDTDFARFPRLRWLNPNTSL